MVIWSQTKVHAKYSNLLFFTMTVYWSICHFCWSNVHSSYNFITLDHWSISNTFWIFTIRTDSCARIPTIIYFALDKMIIFTFTLTCFRIHFWFELHVLLLNLHLQSHEVCFVIVLASFFVIILNALTFWNTHFWRYNVATSSAYIEANHGWTIFKLHRIQINKSRSNQACFII